MKRLALLLAGGYSFALILALLAVWLENVLWPKDPPSSGMHAFGDAVLFVIAFIVFSIPPTVIVFYAWWRRKTRPS